jgi:hypothetical protein
MPRSMPATPRSASNACSTPESPRVSVRENRAYARFSGKAKSAPIASNRLMELLRLRRLHDQDQKYSVSFRMRRHYFNA